MEHYRAFSRSSGTRSGDGARWISRHRGGRSASPGRRRGPSAASEGGRPARPGRSASARTSPSCARGRGVPEDGRGAAGRADPGPRRAGASRDAASAEEGAATTAAGWETEKRDIWRRYRGEKERFERELETLREELAHLKAQKASGDDALRKAHLRIEEAEKAAPSAGKEALPAELEAARERLRETEARVAAGAKEREALVSRLQNAEKRLQWYRLQASSESPLLLSKVRRCERERQELRKVYERVADVAAGFDRERRAAARARRRAPRGGEEPRPPRLPPPRRPGPTRSA